MLAKTWCIVGIVMVLTVGCGKKPEPVPSAPLPQMKPAPATPIDEKRAEIGGAMWNPEWDKIVEEALPPEMLSAEMGKDLRQFCPQFNAIGEADKRAFWAYFFQALAGAEAGLKPTSRALHTQPEMEKKNGVPGQTEGLLQLTYVDAKRYDCDFDWEADRTLKAGDPGRTILQPKNNLECGIKILEKQIVDEHKPLLSRSGYWETLRPGTPGYRVFAKQMANVPPACGVRARRPR